mmetsp:Transcript_28073/g.80550  ORF Transcript_28073/g.80550 Transcript_28073/m.80550 type:complete len:87 (+) Transcript_28073:107-367(+)
MHAGCPPVLFAIGAGDMQKTAVSGYGSPCMHPSAIGADGSNTSVRRGRRSSKTLLRLPLATISGHRPRRCGRGAAPTGRTLHIEGG